MKSCGRYCTGTWIWCLIAHPTMQSVRNCCGSIDSLTPNSADTETEQDCKLAMVFSCNCRPMIWLERPFLLCSVLTSWSEGYLSITHQLLNLSRSHTRFNSCSLVSIMLFLVLIHFHLDDVLLGHTDITLIWKEQFCPFINSQKKQGKLWIKFLASKQCYLLICKTHLL